MFIAEGMQRNGRAETILQRRQKVLQSAYEEHPERFVTRRVPLWGNGPPSPPQLPQAVWINPPEKKREKDTDAVVAAAVELGGKSELGGDLSPNPQPRNRSLDTKL